MDKKNAEKGDKHERLFSNSLKNHPEVLQKLTDYFEIKGAFVRAYPTGAAGGKADVILSFSDPKHLRANVKSFGKVGVNQAARGSVQSFVQKCGLEELSKILDEGVVRKSKKGRFILESDQDFVSQNLSPLAKTVVAYALARLEEPELLVLYDNVKGVMHLYDLRRMLDQMTYEVSFSKPGNIMIGEYILFHRKGGDGNSKKFEKISPKHPGNNLAVKLLCKKVIAGIEPIVSYKTSGK